MVCWAFFLWDIYETSWISYNVSQVFAAPPLRWLVPRMSSVQPSKKLQIFPCALSVWFWVVFFFNDWFCMIHLWTCLFPSLGVSWRMHVSFGIWCTVNKFHFPNLINYFAAIYIHSWILNYFRDYNMLIYDWHTNQSTQWKFRSEIPRINSLFFTSIWS